jgi:hypothetical protein
MRLIAASSFSSFTGFGNRLALDALGDGPLLGGDIVDIVSKVAFACSTTKSSGDRAENHCESCCSSADCASLGGFLSGVARLGLARLGVGTLRLCGSLIRGLTGLTLELLDWLLQSSGQPRGLVAITDGEVGQARSRPYQLTSRSSQQHKRQEGKRPPGGETVQPPAKSAGKPRRDVTAYKERNKTADDEPDGSASPQGSAARAITCGGIKGGEADRHADEGKNDLGGERDDGASEHRSPGDARERSIINWIRGGGAHRGALGWYAATWINHNN